MQHPFVSLWEKPSRLVVGLMSGTSADGVDAALTRITGSGLDSRVEQLGFYFQPFDDATRQKILAVCGGDFGGSREICLLGTHLGKLYAQAVRELLKKTGTERIDLIGCHGQTVWHIPEQTPYLGGTVRGTLQIGDPSYLAEEFGCPVVSDFRIRDMAAGGAGCAPGALYGIPALPQRDRGCGPAKHRRHWQRDAASRRVYPGRGHRL